MGELLCSEEREAFRGADWRLLAWKSMRQANGKWDEQSDEEVRRAGASVPVDLGGATLTAHGCGHQPVCQLPPPPSSDLKVCAGTKIPNPLIT